MTPDELFADLRAAGLSVGLGANGLRVGPRSLLSPERRAAITDNRDALLALVVAELDVETMEPLGERFATSGKAPMPACVEGIAAREGWDMGTTIASIQSLSPADLATYRAALAFDTAALRHVDVSRNGA